MRFTWSVEHGSGRKHPVWAESDLDWIIHQAHKEAEQKKVFISDHTQR